LDHIILSKGLTEEQRGQIERLAKACRKSEPLFLKLNWDMLEERPEDEVNDLFWMQNGKAVGYLGLYSFGTHPAEVEATGMVHPLYRRQGIFSALFAQAVALCGARGAGRLLLIAEDRSLAAGAFVGSLGLLPAFAERRMICRSFTRPARLPAGIGIRPAVWPDDREAVAQLDRVCFGVGEGVTEDRVRKTWVAELDGRVAGKAGLNRDGDLGYLFGVGVLPQYRRRGCGRALLALLLSRYFSERRMPVILEVAEGNKAAVALYRSCGFEDVTVYRYYEKKLP
jgi:ribosomal protein S18 acetylase RimI-like enzyme